MRGNGTKNLIWLWIVLVMAGAVFVMYGCGGRQGAQSASPAEQAAVVSDADTHGQAPPIALETGEPGPAEMMGEPASRFAMTPWSTPQSGAWSADSYSAYYTAAKAFDGGFYLVSGA